MTATVDEQELLQLNVGDFVAVLTNNMGDGKSHWTLGSVESPPYLRDVEIRLWEKQKDEEFTEGDLPNNEETEQLMKRIAEVKGELQKSIDEADALTEQLRARRASIMQQIGEADEYVAESNKVRVAAADEVENIPDRHWNELKSYRVAPKMVSQVIRAVMLLLSEDEARTWPQMQRILRDINFKSRIVTYDPEQQLSPERREYILQECVSKKSFRYDRAMQGSVAVGPIYYWVLAQLDCGEAHSNKSRVDKEKVARQKELRRVLKQLNEQQAHIAEYQALMDDLDDQLRRCREQSVSRSTAGAPGGGSVSRSRLRSLAATRYENSFAGEQQKEYLRPAFYLWRPTDRVIIVLRKNVICNFGPVTKQEQEAGYNMSEPQVRMLDEALLRRQAEAEAEDEEARQRREEEEERQLEADMFAQDAAEKEARARDDEEILSERKRAAAEGKPTPEEPEKPPVTERLKRTFEGNNWQRVLDRKRDDIVSTFTEESAECLEVPDYYISVQDLTVGSLIVAFDVTHDGKRKRKALQAAVDAYDYPKMKALYDEEEDDVVPEHQMKFGGDRWGDIVPYHRAEILDAFLTDTGNATSLARRDIEVLDARVEDGEGLTVDYTIKNSDLSAQEVQELVDQFNYPCVWALYQQLAGLDEAGPLHQVRFRGERWESLLAENGGAISDAFTTDTANALDVTPTHIQTEDMRYERGLTVPYTVSGCPLSEDDIDEKVEEYKYPETWALYDRLVAEACGANFQRAFEGEYWEAVLNEARPALTDAFRKDSAVALDVPVKTIEACSLDTDQDRLLVSFNVVDDSVDPDGVRDGTKNYQYPVTWALYGQTVQEQQEAVASMERAFDGASWGAMIQEKEDLIKKAFQQDVCDQMELPPEAVTVHGVSADQLSMTVKFGVQHDGVLEYDVKRGLESCAYPNTWDLYEELSESELRRRGFGGSSGETSVLERRFEGDDWDILVDGCPDNLRGAFISDTAKCLNTSKSNVRVLSCEVGSLVVSYQITDPEYDDEEIARRVDEWDYEELLGLYKSRIRSGEGEDGEAGAGKDAAKDADTKHTMSFEGDNWAEVVDQRGDEVHEALRNDAAAALGISADDIQDVQVNVKEDSMEAVVTVAPQADQGADEMQDMWDALDASEFPQTWELYEQVLEDNGKHRKRFEGGNWKMIVEQRRNDVAEAFRKDEATCLSAELNEIDVRSVTADEDGVTVGYNLSKKRDDGAELTRDDIQERTEDYDFPAVWGLYEESEYVTTTHQVGFDGDDWKYVVQDKKPELEEAFTTCTAELFALRVRNVVNVRYTLGSLVVDFDLQHPADLGEDEINQKLNDCPYEPVWDLYGGHPYDPNEVVNSQHELGFEGASWQSVIDNNRPGLEKAFVDDTSKALEIKPEDVTVVEFAFEEDSLIARLDVRHPLLQDNDLIQEQLKSYPYDHVWALYEEDPNAVFKTTTHQVGFDGEDWRFVLENKKDALMTAFVTAVAELHDVPDDFVTNVRYTCEKDAMLVDFDLKHPNTITEQEVNDQLGNCGFETVWDLYGEHPYDPNELITTSHEIGFEGDNWAKVLLSRQQQIVDAIVQDTAEALEVPAEDVTDVTTSVTAEVLIARLKVTHHVLQDEEVIQEQLSAYPYERVWAIYENSGVSGELERVFEGDDWDILVDGCPDELRAAFQRDAANALGVTPDRVRVESVEIGSLVVKYKVIDPPASDDEIRRRVDEDEFPELMGMYQRRLRGGGEEGAPEDGKYKKQFPGENWDSCVADNRAAIERAFAKDTAKALSVPKDAITVKSVKATPDGVCVSYDVAAENDSGDAESKTADYEYPAVWALYSDLSDYMTSSHDLRFEAEGWDYVVRRRRWELSRAIADDAAAALGLESEALVDSDMYCTEADLQVTAVFRHRRQLTVEEIHDKLESCSFDRVWALYELLHASGVVLRVFDGDGWTKIAKEQSEELKKAFAEDTAKAVNVSRLEVDVEDVEADKKSLTVSYVVRGCSLSEAEVRQRSADYAYPLTWALYAGSISAHRHFDGENWGGVAQEQREDLANAFCRDTAAATGVAKEAIEVRQVRATDEGLEIDYVISAAKAKRLPKRPVLEQQVNDYAYPYTWELYEPTENEKGAAKRSSKPPLPAGWSETSHQVGFDGEDWAYVVKTKRDKVSEAMKQEVSGCLGVRSENVNDINIIVENQLLVDFTAQHPATMYSQEVDEHLRACKFESIWDLYGEHPYDPNEKTTTEHSVGFEGQDWDYVVEKKRDEVVRAFKVGTGNALTVPESDVINVAIENSADGIVITCSVHHSPLQDQEMIQEQLKSYPYDEMWSLYEIKPFDPNEKIETMHEIEFEGDSWKLVCELQGEEVRRAIAEDTAIALNVDNGDVTSVEFDVSSTALSVRVKVEHSPLQDSEMISEMLSSYEYPNVWALYDLSIESRPMTKTFAGPGWPVISAESEEAIKTAFAADSAAMLNLATNYVAVKGIFATKKEGLEVTYAVFGNAFSVEEVESRAKSYAYPKVWKLYRDKGGDARGFGAGSGETSVLERRFEGDDWDILVDGCPDNLRGAFISDTAKCLNTSKSNVRVLSCEVGSLVVSYQITDPEYDDDEIARRVDEWDYEELLGLYKSRIRSGEGEDGEAGAAGKGKKVTELAVSFDGEDWDYTLEKKSQQVASTFKEETAAALSVSAKDVTITEFVLGSLLVQFKVRHNGRLSDTEMSAKIDSYPYEKVWALYEDRPADAPKSAMSAAMNKTSSIHEVGFQAPNWEYVDRVHHEEILVAFASAAAKACKVDTNDIQGVETSVYPNMMKITATVLHPSTMSAEAVNDAMTAYDFDEVWALYEDEEIGRETGVLKKSFDGDDWAALVQTSKSAIVDAFRMDTSTCMNVPRTSVTVKNVNVSGGLTVEYTVRVSQSCTEADVRRLTDSYPYPEVWALYQPSAGAGQGLSDRANADSAPSQRVFKGASWDMVVEKHRSELKKAFIEDTASATGTTEDQVELISLYTTEGGLVMNHHTTKSGASKAQVEKAVRDAPYAKVWALYRLYADEGYVNTPHGVGFDGEDWDYVLEKNRQTLIDTFIMCTAELLGLQKRHVTKLQVNVEPDNSGVALTFNVNHPRSVNKSTVDKKLQQCAYNPVWQLYETRPYDPQLLVVSSHEVRFEGEDWDFVLQKKKSHVQTAFIADVAEAMQLEQSAVHGIRIERTETGIVIGCNVTHSPLQDDDMIQEELERHEFMRVWDLYEPRPYAPTGDHSVTTHQVGFEGERWAEVMSHRRVKVLNAIRIDTAAALLLTPEDVLEVTTDEQDDIMICTIVVQHPHDQTEDTVQEQLSQYDYDRVWALYDDTIAPQVDVLKNRTNSRMSAVMTKRFEGADWDLAMSEYPQKIREAFATDTAEVLQCKAAQVVVESTTLGSLIVQFRVRDLSMTERKATALTDHYAYPNVWLLYKARSEHDAPSNAQASTSRTRASASRAPPAPIR